MSVRAVFAVLGTAAALCGAVPTGSLGRAGAAPCPDREVVFARGSGEPAGLGGVGQAFVDALRSQEAGRSIGVYPVDYPATHDYAASAAVGNDDARSHIQAVVLNCPVTELVLGGYSQGAAVIELVSAALAPEVTDHVAAVALFGAPTSSYAASIWGGPLPVLAAPYRPKSIELCLPDDIICAEGGNMVAHLMYPQSGLPAQAAAFASSR